MLSAHLQPATFAIVSQVSWAVGVQALSGECGFMAANMYARSIFGEDVLANMSIEKAIHLGKDAPVQGHVRIRAKSQVMLTMILRSFCSALQRC